MTDQKNAANTAPTQQEQDDHLVTCATQCFLSNPLGCVAYNAYGVLLLQVLQECPVWADIKQRSVSVQPADLAGARPCLVHLNRVWPPSDHLNPLDVQGINPLDVQGIRGLVDNLAYSLGTWCLVHGTTKVLAGSVRVTYAQNNTAGIEFIVVSPTPTKGQ